MTFKLFLPHRRHLTLIACLLMSSCFAFSQISLVHVTTCGPQAFPAATCTIPSTGSGNLLVAAWTSGSGGGGTAIAGMTDNVGNVYAEAGSAKATDTGANTMADMWYVGNSIPGATTITITPSPSGASGTAVIWELSGVQPFTPLDQTSVLNSQSATTTPSGAAVVTTFPAEAVISLVHSAAAVSGISSGNTFFGDFTSGDEGGAHLLTSTSGTYAPQWTTTTSGTFCSSTVSFKAASTSGGACDLNQDGVVNVADVQLAVNIDLGVLPCPSVLDGGVCGSSLVQQIVNAVLGQGCSVTVTHSVSLTWVASSSGNIAGYNVFRSTTSGGPYTQLNTSLVASTSYTDTTVTAGQIYYYVTTAVDSSNNQSGYSNQTQAIVPITI